MKIQLLLLLAAVAVYCESPPRLIQPVPEPGLVVDPFPAKPNQPFKLKLPTFLDPEGDRAQFSSYFFITPAVNEYLKERNPNAQLAYVPFKVLSCMTQSETQFPHFIDIEMAESTCKIDDYHAKIPDECPLTGKGAPYTFRGVIGIRYGKVMLLELIRLKEYE